MQDEGIHVYVGDIWWQMAQIADIVPKEESKEAENDTLILHVSDEHGLITKTTNMPRHMFEKQFTPDDKTPNLFSRRIRIEAIEDDGKSILFKRIDETGKELGESQRILRRILLDTYFIPQIQMGQTSREE